MTEYEYAVEFTIRDRTERGGYRKVKRYSAPMSRDLARRHTQEVRAGGSGMYRGGRVVRRPVASWEPDVDDAVADATTEAMA